MIYATPSCGPEEQAAVERIQRQWGELRFYVAHHNRRWMGSVRRVLAAVANQGSNTIEGYNISTEDAIAAIQGAVEPTDTRWEDWQANLGYRRAMTYVLQLANDPHFEYSPSLFRSLHFMMVEHSLDASPGLWRPGPIWIRNDQSGEVVYEGPEAERVPSLIQELIEDLDAEMDCDAIVRAAMAHLNFVLIHPFRDGNGRMARCLQSLVLVRGGHLAREFCSIEEYLGQPRNQQAYYDILTSVARGRWSPSRDARPWVRFCLGAHYIQALSVIRRVRESEWIWERLEELTTKHRLPLRAIDALFDGSLGLKVRNSSYRASLESVGEEISNQTATHDLRAMVKAGLLVPHGAKRGTYYVAAPELRQIREDARRSRQPITAAGLFDPITDEDETLPTWHAPQPELFPRAAQA